jgi:cell filamentation protein
MRLYKSTRWQEGRSVLDGFGKYDIYAECGSRYCYAGTSVLRNRFGIRDANKLRQVEADVTTVRQHDLLLKPVTGHFTANHLCRIHRELFGDIYPFAGHYRREIIKKGKTTFENPESIEKKLKELLSELKTEKFLQTLKEDAFLKRLAYYFAELNYLHPFREGNGRATREFIRQLLLRDGYTVDWSAVSAEELLSAMEASVYETEPLIRVLQKCVEKND